MWQQTVNAKIEEKGISKDDVEGVGIGVPGPVNSKGEVDRAVNLYWGLQECCRRNGGTDRTSCKSWQ